MKTIMFEWMFGTKTDGGDRLRPMVDNLHVGHVAAVVFVADMSNVQLGRLSDIVA